MPIPEGLILDLSAKMSSILLLKYWNTSLCNLTWYVAPVSISHASLQEVNEVLKQIFSYSHISMGNDVMSKFRCFPDMIFYLFVLYDFFYFWYYPMGIYNHSLHVIQSFCNGWSEYWFSHLCCVYPPTFEFLSSKSSFAYLSSWGIMWLIISFLRKERYLISGMGWLLSKGFLMSHNFLHQSVKCDGFHFNTSLQRVGSENM